MIQTKGVDKTKQICIEPLTHRRYCIAMTLCVASTFAWSENERAAILCTDCRIDGGAWGKSETAIKVHGIGYNFFALMAGHWDTVRDWCQFVDRGHVAMPKAPASPSEALSRIRSLSEDFAKTPLCRLGPTDRAEILVSGFIGKNHLMLRGSIDASRTVELQIAHDFDAVGEGEQAALIMLRNRQYDPFNQSFASACYLVYEAKRFAETVGSVGPKTRIAIHRPLMYPPNFVRLPEGQIEGDQYAVIDINDEGLAQLEAARHELFVMRPVDGFSFTGKFTGY